MATSDDLFCPLCFKCSPNKKAHIRHTSYCRQKAKKPPRSRKRSCLACIKAKTRCDVAASLRCSRCSQKEIECKLEGSQRDIAVTARSEPRFSIGVDDLCNTSALSCSQSESLLADWNDTSISHISPNEPRDTALSHFNQTVQQTSHFPISSASKLPEALLVSSSKDGMDRCLPHPTSILWNGMNSHALGPQLNLHPVKAFTPRGAIWGRFSLLGRHIAQTLRRYPYMMLSGDNPPPLIHHACLANNNTHKHKGGPGPLLRCVAIVELWSSKTPSNAIHLWKMLRIEQERLMQEISEYGDVLAVMALQAVTIYFLLRLSSTDDEETTFDVPLIYTMTQLSWRVRGVINAYCDPTSPVKPNIFDWVMAESLRRTIATLFIIELLFDISPGMIDERCNSLAPWSEMLLPCCQQLWEAKSEAAWTLCYDLMGDKRPYYGELLQHEYLDHARSTLLDQWMANVDDFGKLVINIASVAEVAC